MGWLKMRISIALVLFFLFGLTTHNCLADAFTFTPSPADIYGLDHFKYYTWGLTPNLPDEVLITGATIHFDNIRNNNNDPNDLYLHLLDETTDGLTTYHDHQGGGDNFLGQGILLEHWQNL